MISPVTASKIYSTLGNNDSLVPMAIKDTSNSIGLTAGSYITGKSAESQDRLIDEFGTQAIWLFGIPAYKKFLDLVLFKPLGFDAGVDVRILKDKDVFEKAKKFAKIHDETFKDNPKVKQIAKSLENISSKQEMFKTLTLGKFVISTLFTILTYGGLTSFRQKYREKKIIKEFYQKEALKKEQQDKVKSSVPTTFEKIKGNDKTTNFTGSVQDVMFSPVKNIMIVDAAITTERLASSQNWQEFIGYAIKEGTFWFFMYFAGQQIKSLFEKHSLKKHNLPIDLDARVIESDDLKDAIINKKSNDLYKFPAGKPADAEIYEFVNSNEDNLIVKMAKKCEIIKTFKGTDVIDNRKFINPEEIKGLKDKLILLFNKGNEYVLSAKAKSKAIAEKSGQKTYELTNEEEKKILNDYLNKVKKANRGATLKNIGACIGFIGILVPAVLVGWRFMNKNNKEYRVRADIEKKLKEQMTKQTEKMQKI